MSNHEVLTPEKTTTETVTPVSDPKFKDFLEAIKKPIEEDKTPAMYAIVLHNDGSTNPYFVCRVLEEAFNVPNQRAWQIMMAVHNGTRGVVVILSKEEAEAALRVAQTMIANAVQGEDFGPHAAACELTFTMELETKGEGE